MKTFLEAHRIVQAFTGGPALPFRLAMSGTAEPLLPFLRAAGATRGREAQPSVLPFNTLQQALLQPPDGPEVLLLMPWDVLPELDWRSGATQEAEPEDILRSRAESVLQRVVSRRSPLLYLPAAVPPLASDPARDHALLMWIEAELRLAGAHVLAGEAFALAAYLASGTPIASGFLGDVAMAAVEALLGAPPPVAKVLVTDLDNTVWSGIIGDDGPEGIAAGPEGRGFPHFVYQGLLRRLRNDGVLLAAVTKNDPDVALAPFRNGQLLLQEDDFVAFLASWSPKSAQIRELAERLNLGLDAFVFVDDNPIELEEVSLELPAVRTLQFPANVAAVPSLLQALRHAFRREALTAEDRERTALYRRRLEGMAPTDATGADLSAFLSGLEMVLRITDRSAGDRTRVVQLINKTNQFNLNGERLADSTVADMLASGGRLYGATLEDRTGSHGEILACLVDDAGEVRSLVMSCRVFQRRVEHAFLAWLCASELPPRALHYRPTERNGPLQGFLRELVELPLEGGIVPFEAERFLTAHGDGPSPVRIEIDGAQP